MTWEPQPTFRNLSVGERFRWVATGALYVKVGSSRYGIPGTSHTYLTDRNDFFVSRADDAQPDDQMLCDDCGEHFTRCEGTDDPVPLCAWCELRGRRNV